MTTDDHGGMTTHLREVVAEICAYEPGEIEDEALLFDDLGLDSISLLDVLATMSGTYSQLVGIAPQELDIGDRTTYADLERLMISVVSGRTTEGAVE